MRISDWSSDVCSSDLAALRELTLRLDGADLEDLFVDKREFALAEFAVAPALRLAMAEAVQRIQRFHAEGLQRPYAVEHAPGGACHPVVRPPARAGLYVPHGRAPFPSTVLSLGHPAP